MQVMMGNDHDDDGLLGARIGRQASKLTQATTPTTKSRPQQERSNYTQLR